MPNFNKTATCAVFFGRRGNVEVSLEGVYELPKAAGAIDPGAKVYWVAADKNVSTADGSRANRLIGAATQAAGGSDEGPGELNGVAII